MEMIDYKGNRICREILLQGDALYIKDQAEGQVIQSYLHSVEEIEVSSTAEMIRDEVMYAPEYGLLKTVYQITTIGNGCIEVIVPLA